MTLKDAESFVSTIGNAIRQDKAGDFGLEANSLKSIAAQVGAINLSEMAKKLEFIGKENKIEDASALL